MSLLQTHAAAVMPAPNTVLLSASGAALHCRLRALLVQKAVLRASSGAQTCWVEPWKQDGNGTSSGIDEDWMLQVIHLLRGLCFQAF